MHAISAKTLRNGVEAVSSLSLYEGLVLTCLGATKHSETHKEIYALLVFHTDDEDGFLLESKTMRDALLKEHVDVSLEMGNSLWGDDMKPAYTDFCTKRMDAQVRPLAGSSVINAWVTERTKDMIPCLLTTDPPGPVVFVNVFAVKAMWTQSFALDKTFSVKFYRGVDAHGPSDPVVCDMMTGTEEFHYTSLSTEDGDLQVVELSYDPRTHGNQFVVYVLLPELLGSVDKTLEVFVQDAEAFDALVDSMKPQKVRLDLPRFTVESNTSVKDDLISLGIHTAFGASAAFARLTDADVFVKDVVHSVKIVVDEVGTETAAATTVVFATKGAGGRKKDYIEMHVDRKFIFLLRWRVTQALLFAAVVTNPRPLKA